MRMPERYQVIIFDWDGTIVDSKGKIVDCLCNAAIRLGLSLDKDNAKDIIGLALPVAVKELFPDLSDHEVDNFISAYKENFFAYPKESEIFAGVVDLLNWIGGYPEVFMAVATGKSRAGLDRELEQYDLKKYFHITRCADETTSKPHPQMLNEILDYTAVDKQQALMIGDTDFDVIMAHNAGIDSLALTCGAHDLERLKLSNPCAILNSVADVKNWLIETEPGD